ncbi:MAG TPA: S53 family peptidase [Streptosporangiaceae bacterium]|jgi:kumamolisin|nr:S53 family peptidase [Streptosporangiaceae bacterium]
MITSLAVAGLCVSAIPAAGAAPARRAAATVAPAGAHHAGSGYGGGQGMTAGGGSLWESLLARADDLGPSRAATANVLVALRTARRPQALLGWAARCGLRATWFTGQPTALLAGSPVVLGRALRTRIDDFRLPGNPGTFYASRRAGSIPAALSGEVVALGRITSLGHVHPGVPGPVRPEGGVPVGGLTPGGFADSYGIRPLWDSGEVGRGETIVFFEVDGYSAADLAAYAARFGLPAFTDPLPHLGPLNLKVQGESDMDLEVAHAIAPAATLVYVNLTAFGGKNSSAASQFQQAFSKVAQDYPGAIWSVSLGQCEDLFSPTDAAAVNNAVSAAEQAGTSAFVASGDSGGMECLAASRQDPRIPAEGVSFPGDLPRVTSVGGTTLALTTAGQYLGETTWTEPLLSLGSTGGQSTLFTQPPWQRAPGVDSSYSDGAVCGNPAGYCREVPDVSADAATATGAAVRVKGAWVTVGGTSLATPVWAALTSLMDTYLRSHGDRPVGFVNPLLYRLAQGSPRFPPFHDVTVGTNDFYPAGPGYDMVTGIGTPDAWNLTRDLAPLAGRS